MKINRPLVPKFLKNAEHKLLINQPEIWSARTHLVIYYGLILIITLAGLSFIVPLNVRFTTTVGYWIGFVSIISIIALIVWLIYLLRFNVFKRFGSTGPGDRLITFLLYFISAGIIVLFNYVNPIVESARANNAFGDEEIVHDINRINTKICQLEYNLLNHEWTIDTLLVVDSFALSNYYGDENVDVVESTGSINRHFRKIDTAMLNNKIKQADSLVKVNDSIYLEYDCPEYVFVDPYNADNYTQEKQYGSVDIYSKIISDFKPPVDRENLRKELLLITNKYLDGMDTTKYYVDANANGFAKIMQKYHTSIVQTSINNVVSKKYRWRELSIFLHVFYYVTLTLSLLIFIFRHSTARTFFLSLLTAVIIGILTALVLAFGSSDSLTFLSWMIGYTVLFLIISLMVWRTAIRRTITGISLNIFVFMVPFVPLLLTAWYYQYLDLKNKAAYPTLLYNSTEYARNMIISEIAGFLLLLILMGTYINSAYRQWFSLPEE